MSKLLVTYTIAAILAFHSGFAFAGTKKQTDKQVARHVQQLLLKAQKASIEEIADLQTELKNLRNEVKKHKRIENEVSRQIGRIQHRVEQLMMELETAMR